MRCLFALLGIVSLSGRDIFCVALDHLCKWTARDLVPNAKVLRCHHHLVKGGTSVGGVAHVSGGGMGGRGWHPWGVEQRSSCSWNHWSSNRAFFKGSEVTYNAQTNSAQKAEGYPVWSCKGAGWPHINVVTNGWRRELVRITTKLFMRKKDEAGHVNRLVETKHGACNERKTNGGPGTTLHVLPTAGAKSLHDVEEWVHSRCTWVFFFVFLIHPPPPPTVLGVLLQLLAMSTKLLQFAASHESQPFTKEYSWL